MPLKNLSHYWKRFWRSTGPASKQVRFYALIPIAGFCIFFIIPRKTLSQRVDEVIHRWDEQRLELTGRAAQQKLISLFLELEDAGDNRRMARMAPIFLQGPFPQKDIETVAQTAFRLLQYWNDAPPPWQWALYQKINAFHPSHQEGPYCRLHEERTRVRFQFQSQEPYSRLYLAGNWTDSSGRLAQFAGYKPVEMKDAGGGQWSISRSMQRSPFTHAYQCVVRTAPWPAGRAVGWAAFHLSGENSRVVRIPPKKPEPAPPRQPPLAPSVHSRVALVGVDGASWHVLLPFIQRDALPHWSRLLQQGCAVRLTASGGRYAYASLPSIHTAMTGYLPARHQTKKEYFGFSIRPPVPRVWDSASQHGLRVGTIGMWGTFPVEHINGDMVSEAFFFIRTIDNPILKDIIYSPWTVKFAESFGVKLEDLTKLMSLAQWVKKYVETVFPAGLEKELQQLLPPPAPIGVRGYRDIKRHDI